VVFLWLGIVKFSSKFVFTYTLPMTSFPLNTSSKYHITLALIISLWLVLFLILIAPFDIAELTFSARLEILPIYGLISFMVYLFLVPIQNWAFKYFEKNTLFSEVLFIIMFNCIQIIFSYRYYKSSIVNGNYNFQKFCSIFMFLYFFLTRIKSLTNYLFGIPTLMRPCKILYLPWSIQTDGIRAFR